MLFLQDFGHFAVRGGKTYILRKEEELFGDFALKFIGTISVKHGTEGKWVASCGVESFGHLEAK